MPNSLLPYLAGAIPIIIFPFMWCGIIYVIAVTGGWPKLAAMYENKANIRPHTKVSMQSVGLGRWTGYNNIVRLGVADEGFIMEMPWLFHWGHAPLLIPWEEMVAFSSQRFLVGKMVKLVFQKTPDLQVFIHPKANEKLAAAAGPVWPELLPDQ